MLAIALAVECIAARAVADGQARGSGRGASCQRLSLNTIAGIGLLSRAAAFACSRRRLGSFFGRLLMSQPDRAISLRRYRNCTRA